MRTNDASDGNELCGWCSRFDFHGWFQIGRAKRDAERSEIKLRNLGHLHEIQNKPNCAFCRMILHVAKQHCKPDLDIPSAMDNHIRCLVTPIDVCQIETKKVSRPQLIRRLEVHFYSGVTFISPNQIQMLDDSITGKRLEQWRDDEIKRGHNPDINIDKLKDWMPFDGALGCSGGLLASEDLDLSIVKGWLDECVQKHTNTCSVPRTDHLRVIDAIAMKLCPAQLGLSYAALSYLWGGVHMLKTTKENFERLSQENGIQEDKIPLTIRDSIHFLRKIGWQYLWVDALCIIQVDENDKASQISQMQAIYRFANFTIVAASGIDSNAGLPGIHAPRKVSQHIERIHGLRLVTTLPSYKHILESSRWNSRAWTFQESMLSRRLVIFSEGQMHFTCEGGEYCEDTRLSLKPSKLEQPSALYKSTSLLRGAPWGRGYKIFQDLVAQYSQRELSYPDDILNGFSGIINALRPFGNIGQYFHAGLPLERLVESLLWFPSYRMSTDLRRLDTWQPHFTRRIGSYKPVYPYYHQVEEKDDTIHIFPSWSWIGWTGDIDYLHEPGAIKEDCQAKATPFLLTITARILSFAVKKSSKSGIPMTTFDIYDIINSNGEKISDFVHSIHLLTQHESKTFEFLLLLTVDPKNAEDHVRPKQWKPTSRFRSMGEAIAAHREVHDGPFMNAMMIERSEKYFEEPAERVAVVYVPMRYWGSEGVRRETVVIG